MLNIDQLYAACAAPEVCAHPVSDVLLRQFSRAIMETDRIAKAEGVEQLIHSLLVRTRAIRFTLIASPISGNDESLRLELLSKRLEASMVELKMTASKAVVMAFSKLAPLVSKIAHESKSPLGDKLLDLLQTQKRQGKTCAIVLPQHHLQSLTDTWIRSKDAIVKPTANSAVESS